MILDRLFESRATLANPTGWLTAALQAEPTASGVTISASNALTVPAVLSAVQLIAGTIGQLPLKVFRRLPDNAGKIAEPNHSLYRVIHDRPNPELDSCQFWELITTSMLLHGNAYCEVERDRRGRPIALWPLAPDAMAVGRGDDGRIVYEFRSSSGAITWVDDEIHPPIFHLKAFTGGNTLVGSSVIAHCRETLGLSRALQDHGAALFANGARPGGVLQTKGQLSAEAHARLKQGFEQLHRGAANHHRLAVLEDGVEFHPIGIPPEDAQFLESRRFQVDDVARIFRVPAHLIGSLERSTFSNIEHQSLEYVTHSMGPWFRRIEAGVDRQLLGRTSTHFTKFVTDALLRADTATRMTALSTAINAGILSVNEARSIEDRNARPGGDELIRPLNMALINNGGPDDQS